MKSLPFSPYLKDGLQSQRNIGEAGKGGRIEKLLRGERTALHEGDDPEPEEGGGDGLVPRALEAHGNMPVHGGEDPGAVVQTGERLDQAVRHPRLAESAAVALSVAVADQVEELDDAGGVLGRGQQGFESAEEYL